MILRYIILSFNIALRFHRSAQSNIFISLVSLVSTMIVAVGIFASILALSIVNGFEQELNKRVLSIIPHCEIKLIDFSFINYKEIFEYIQKIPNVFRVNPYISFSGIIEYNNKWHAVHIRSIDVDQEIYLCKLHSFISEDAWKKFQERKNQIILGKGVLDILKIKSGDYITIFIHSNSQCKQKLLPLKKICLQVAGTLDLNSQLDRNLAMISLLDAQSYSNQKLRIEGISIQLHNAFHVHQVMKKIKQKINKYYIYMHSWMDIYGYIYRDIQMIRTILYISIILIIYIACFSAITTLIISIKYKNPDFIILKALGANEILIQSIFLWYGLIIYFFSSIIGVTLGVLTTLNITYLSIKFNNFLNNTNVLKEIYFIDFIPAKLDYQDILIILCITFLFGILISWYLSIKMNKNLFIKNY